MAILLYEYVHRLNESLNLLCDSLVCLFVCVIVQLTLALISCLLYSDALILNTLN